CVVNRRILDTCCRVPEHPLPSLRACSRITRPPPTLTLFPYTTLFRSHRFLAAAAAAVRFPPISPETFMGPSRPDRRFRPSQPTGDRKSTRLNSSHDQSSYAVFCLKKKNRWRLQ